MPRLGIPPNGLPDGVRNANGSYIFTDYASLISGKPTDFSVHLQNDVYRGAYRGLAAIRASKAQGLRQFAATDLSELRKNGQAIFKLPEPRNVFIDLDSGSVTIVDSAKTTRPTVNIL